MKTTDNFKKAVQAHLESVAANDPLFAETLKKPNKNIDDCITYILNEVKKSGCVGFEDDEIFGMSIHFYDEDDVKPGNKIDCKVVVNHTVKLSADDLKDAKALAMEKAISEAKEKIVKKKAVKKTEAKVNQTDIFGL